MYGGIAAGRTSAFSVLSVKFFTDYVIKGAGRFNLMLGHVAGGIRNVVVGIRRRFERHTSLLGHEIYRVFICHGAIVVIIVLAIFVASDSKPYKVRYIDLDSYCERIYLEELQGPVTQEKLDYLDAEEQRVRKLSDDYARSQRRAITRIRSRIAYIEKNEGAYLMYDEPHNMLTAYYSDSSDFMHAVICMVPIALMMPCFFAPDLQSGVSKVTDVTMRGKRKLSRLRYVFGTVLAAFVAIGVHLPYFMQVFVSYEMDAEVFAYPVNSLTHFSRFGSDMSVATYYLIIYGLRVLFTVLGAFLIYGLSRLLKSQAYTTLVGFIMLVVPTLAVMYDYRLKPAAYPYSAMFGNLFMRNKVNALVCVVAVAVTVIVLRLAISLRSGKGFLGAKYRSRK